MIASSVGGKWRARQAQARLTLATHRTPRLSTMKIQSTIAGFSGEPITMVGNLDEKTGVLVVVKAVKFREERIAPDFALVSNLDLPELDFLFTDKLLRETIRSYYTRKAQLTLDIMTEASRFQPDNKIEQESVDEGGRRYRIAPDIQNGQMAILAMVAIVQAQSHVESAISMANEMADFYSVISI